MGASGSCAGPPEEGALPEKLDAVEEESDEEDDTEDDAPEPLEPGAAGPAGTGPLPRRERKRSRLRGMQGRISDKASRLHARKQALLHRQKHGDRMSRPSAERLKAAAGVLYVEVLGAADLHQSGAFTAIATCDAYCSAAVGAAGAPWPTKSRSAGGCPVTALAPRQRSPRWGERLVVPTPSTPGFEREPHMELSVRAMDLKTIGSDVALGEVAIDLQQQPGGAGCFRLSGGGYSSISLRWALVGSSDREPAELPRGSAAFEEAVGFWCSRRARKSQEFQEAAAALTQLLRSSSAGGDDALANELLLQAPLASLPLPLLADAFEGVRPQLELQTCARLALAVLEHLQAGSTSRGSSHNKISVRSDHQSLQKLLHDFFCCTSGQQLTDLKRLVDTAGTGCDMQAVVDSALGDTRLRAGLLEHLRAEAGRTVERPLHVLSDIDMTLWIGKFGKGGPKFPEGMIPGALPLLRALGGQITFLSARPSFVEATTRQALFDVGLLEVAILRGSLSTLLGDVRRGDSVMTSGKKDDNFTIFEALHPEALCIFFGDTGEGDVEFAARRFGSATSSSHGVNAKLALVHDMVDEKGLHPCTRAPRREELRSCGVHVFDTYAGAAVELCSAGLLSSPQLRRAAQGCVNEFCSISPTAYAHEDVYVARRAELCKDLDVVDEALLRAALEPLDRKVSVDDPPWWRL